MTLGAALFSPRGPSAPACSPRRVRCLPLVCLPLLAMLAVLPGLARAATAPKPETSFGTRKSSGPYLTHEQLRDCFAKQDKLRTEDAELVDERAAVVADRASLTRADAAAEAQRDTLDRTNAEAVGAYNEAVEARNKQVEALQTRSTAFNERIAANTQAHASFGTACSNRRYFDEDAAAIRNGR